MPVPLSLNPVLWLDASELSAGSLATWPDKSGYGRNAVGSGTVIANALNGLSVMQFQKSLTQQLISTVDLSAGDWTVVGIGRLTTVQDWQRVITSLVHTSDDIWLLGWWRAAQDQAFYGGWVTPSGSPSATTDWKLYTGIGSGSVGYFYSSGTLLASGSPHAGPKTLGFGGSDTTAIGGTNEFSDSQGAELIAFNCALSDTDRQAVESYLYDKWWLSAVTAGTVSTSSVTGTTLTVSTTAASGGLSPYTYQFQRAPDASGSPGVWANIGSNSSSTSYGDSGLSSGTYWYRCIVTDGGTKTATASAVSVSTTPPGVAARLVRSLIGR
jgi:hypothetical protein